MSKLVEFAPTRTFANAKNAIRAVEKTFGESNDLRYVMMQNSEGRFYPLFIGNSALMAGVHFHFCCMN